MKKHKQKQNLTGSNSTAITYWNAIIDLVHLDTRGFNKVVQQLEHGEYKGVNFDLKNTQGSYPLYGIKLNDTNRVLCTTIKVDDQAYLLLLELVPNHDYQKARFMDKAVLEQFINRNNSAFAEYIRKLVRRSESHSDTQVKKHNTYPKSLTLHQNKIIQLSDEQNTALLNQNKALLISGGPGSGKSVLALSVLDKVFERDNDVETGEVLLYVSQSQALVSKMERIWNEQPHSNQLQKTVLFRTFNSLFKEHNQVSDQNLVNKKHYTEWLAQYLKKAINKQNPALSELLAAHNKDERKIQELIYQEFRIISGHTLADYLPADNSRSVVDSLFLEATHRQWISTAYAVYLEVLSSEGAFHPALCPINNKKDVKYSFIVVDESQDFSLGQLRTIHSWSTLHRIVFFNDSHQILEDNKSKTQFILDLCRQGPFAQTLLEGSYRCPREVVSFANAIMELKLILTGGLTDKFQQAQFKLNKEQEELHTERSHVVQWFERIEDISNQALLMDKIKDSAQVAVVTLEEYKNEAKKRFNTVSVFTPEDIKGLEFPLIFVYNPLDEPIFRAANKEPVMAELEQHTIPKNRPKADKENNQFGPPFNRLYAAVTRCTEHLVIIQESSHAIEHITTYLKSKINSRQSAKPSVVVDNLIKDSSETWHKRAREALENNNQGYAQAIFETHLHQTKEEFMEWVRLEGVQSNTSKDSHPRPVKVVQSRSKPIPKALKSTLVKAIRENNDGVIKRLVYQAFHENIPSILHYLLSKVETKNKLYDLLSDSVFIKKILKQPYFIEVFCALNYEGDGSVNNNTSAFYGLLFDKDDRATVKQLFSDTSFFEKIIAYDGFYYTLLARRNKQAGADENRSILFYLLGSADLDQVLMQLRTNSSFITKLVAHDDFYTTLVARANRQAGVVENVSALYFLFSTLEGQKVLMQLSANSSFIAKIVARDDFYAALLARRNQQAGTFDNTSALYWLLYAIEGWKLLAQLCTNDTFITKLMDCDEFYTALLARPAQLPGALNNISAFYLLFNQPVQGEEVRLLFQWCANPIFVSKLKAHPDFIYTLNIPIESAIPGAPDTSLFLYLSSIAKGREWLQKFGIDTEKNEHNDEKAAVTHERSKDYFFAPSAKLKEENQSNQVEANTP